MTRGNHVELRACWAEVALFPLFTATTHIFQFLCELLIGLGCRPFFYRLVTVFWDIKGCCMYAHDARGTKVQYLLYTAFYEYNRQDINIRICVSSMSFPIQYSTLL
jgi:hypothetical protein